MSGQGGTVDCVSECEDSALEFAFSISFQTLTSKFTPFLILIQLQEDAGIEQTAVWYRERMIGRGLVEGSFKTSGFSTDFSSHPCGKALPVSTLRTLTRSNSQKLKKWPLSDLIVWFIAAHFMGLQRGYERSSNKGTLARKISLAKEKCKSSGQRFVKC